MKDIAVIAPIEDVYEKARQIVEERGYSNVEVLRGSMSVGVEEARKALAQGAKIIVTRGGTYRMVKANCPGVLAVEIKVGAHDLIESFHKISPEKQTIGIVGYSNVIYGIEMLKALLPHDIAVIEIKQEEEIYDIIRSHKERGIQTYIGDSNVTAIVRELGCKGILIHSQKESVLTAIQEARRILSATKEEKRRTQQIITMTDFIHDGIIAIDESQTITVFNRMAEKIFSIPKERAIGSKILSIVPNSKLPQVLETGKPEIGQLQTIGRAQITTNRIPILVDDEVQGAVATFQDVTELQHLEQKIRQSLNEKGFVARYTFSDIIYTSQSIRQCIETARQYAQYDTPVHICGPSGVGKELFCQSMHNAGPRRKGPFVAINCAAIPPSLIESELFGYDEGSFTGARRKGKPGIFELAHNGTLFLDEISEIPMNLQGRLLRILQEKQVMRIGGNKLIPVDVKIVTASNQYLKRMMEEGKFRKDLYFRINVLTLRIPNLDRRPEDVLVLAEHFIQKYAALYNKPPLKLSEGTKRILSSRHYEGNVRELEGMIERCMVVSSFDSLEEGRESKSVPLSMFGEPLPDMDLQTLENNYIKAVYRKTGGNLKQCCQVLGVSRTTLWRKLKSLGCC